MVVIPKHTCFLFMATIWQKFGNSSDSSMDLSLNIDVLKLLPKHFDLIYVFICNIFCPLNFKEVIDKIIKIWPQFDMSHYKYVFLPGYSLT